MSGSYSLLADRSVGRGNRPHLLTGWDGSEEGMAVVAFAAELAGDLNAQVDVVHVQELGDTPIDPDVADWDRQVRIHMESLEQRIETELSGLGAGWTYHVAHGGSPGPLLLHIAEDLHPYMLVLGMPHSGLLALLEEIRGHQVSRSLLTRNHLLPLCFVPVTDHGHSRHKP